VRVFMTQLSPLILPALRGVPSLCHVTWLRSLCPRGSKVLPDGSACGAPAGAACYRNRCVPLRDGLPLQLQMELWRRHRDAFNLIVACSEHIRGHLLAEGIGPVEVVRNGVPVTAMRPPLSEPPT